MKIIDYQEKKFFSDDEQPQAIVIAFHGYTSNADWILNDLSLLHVSDAILIAPNSPNPSRIQLSDRIDGRQWAEIDDEWMENRSYDYQICYDRFQEITPDIINFIEEQLEKYDLEYSDLFLFGFSQGATLVNHVGLQTSIPCAGIISLGGFVVSPELLEHNIHSKPDILLINGNADSIVPVNLYDESMQFFEENDFNLEKHLIENLGHVINDEVIELTNNFINERIMTDDLL